MNKVVPSKISGRGARTTSVAAKVLLLGVSAFSLVASPALAQDAGQREQSEATATFNIPSQPLAGAVTAFGLQSGFQVSVDQATLAGLNSTGISGNFPPAEALSRLLTGTGVTWRLTQPKSVTLYKAPQSADGAIQLGPVRVEGDGGSNSGGYHTSVPVDSPITEGTRSYTTRQMAGSTGLPLSPRETPQSVSVVTRQRIDDQASLSLVDVLANTPGIAFSQLDSERTVFSARGFSISDFQHDGVSTFYTSQYAAGESEMDMVIYDRIEVVRGATGLLTGAGNPSAAINLVRKRAISREQTGNFSLSAGSWELYRGTADISSPITANGDVRVRLVGSYENKNNFFDNYHRERAVVYAAIDADVTSDTTLSVGASYKYSDAEGITYGGLPLFYSNGEEIDWRGFGRSFSIWPKWSQEHVDMYSAFANFEHRFGNGWTANLVGMYSKNKISGSRLFPWGFPDEETGLMTANPSRVNFPGERTQKTADLRVSGPFHIAGREHELIIGFNYSQNETDFDRVAASDTPPTLSLFEWASYPEPSSWGTTVSSGTWNRKQTAGYGALRLSLADPLKVIVGGRYTHWNKIGTGYNGANPFEYKKNKFIPYAGIIFDINSNWSAYASYTSIFDPQDVRDRNGDFLDPLTGDSYELGVKGEFFDGRLNASVALFRIQQDNLGVADTGYIVPGTTQQAYLSVKGARSQGVEAEITGELLPGWNLSLSANHFKIEDRDGTKLNTDIPRTQVRLFTTYQLSGALEGLTIGGGANWQSRVYAPTGSYHWDSPSPGIYEEKPYLVANLMARYRFTENVSLQANINNIFDKYYMTGVNFNEQRIWGSPRSALATLTFGF
ncbi:MAG: TonB-dependent siderophore receptor [Sphingobium sp.]